MGRFRGMLAAVGLAIALATGMMGTGSAAAALTTEPSEDDSHSAVTYVATALLDVFYVPAKVVVGGAGVVTSSLAYLVTVGDSDTFSSVWNSAVKGDYVLTPRMVEGKDPVHFAGLRPAE